MHIVYIYIRKPNLYTELRRNFFLFSLFSRNRTGSMKTLILSTFFPIQTHFVFFQKKKKKKKNLVSDDKKFSFVSKKAFVTRSEEGDLKSIITFRLCLRYFFLV